MSKKPPVSHHFYLSRYLSSGRHNPALRDIYLAEIPHYFLLNPENTFDLGAAVRKIIQTARRIPLAVSRLPSDAARDRTGIAAVEFALVAPVLMLVLFGIIQFGLTLNNYLVLTDAVQAGARQFSISRASATPWTTATTAVTSAAPNLTAANITITLRVNGTACASDAACQTALSAAAGGASSVTATYPCNLAIMGVNYAPGCTLTSQTTNLVE